LSVSVAPAIAEDEAATKWIVHITNAASPMMFFKMPKAREYHINALAINTILASADLPVIPNFPSTIWHLTIKLFVFDLR